MKHALFLIFCSILNFSVHAQVIPNASFENWFNQGPYEEPVGWATQNLENGVVTASKTTDAYAGNFALKIQTGFISDSMSQFYFGANVISTALPNHFGGGFPINYKPEKLTGYFKFEPFGDSCMMAVYFTKANSQTGQTDIIGGGFFKTGAQHSNYTYFEAPISFLTNELPDTAFILLSPNQGDSLNENTVLFVDALTFDGVTGLSEELPKIGYLTIYPNPVISKATITMASPAEMRDVLVVDLLGRTILSKKVTSHSNSIEIDFSNQPEGIYIVKVTDQAGKEFQSKLHKIK